MKPSKILLIMCLFAIGSFAKAQSWECPFLISTIANQNVYKTKTDITLTKVYDLNTEKAISDTTKYILTLDSISYLKYKVVEDGDNPYIRLLPRLKFETLNKDTFYIKYSEDAVTMADQNPTNYYFKMVDDPEPNNHYLATESIMGMPISMPIKMRNLDGKTKIELDFSLGYAFGYKVKFGNNPYRKKFLNVIPFALGINKDSYFTKADDGTYTEEKESISFTYYSFGLAYEYYGLNIGFFMGWDRMFNEQKDWAYQSKSWFSIGIGYKIGGDE